ncbi:MAG TPA: lysozyme inhibitor LprI family protein [Xanthobacteraceae bacterium]|nr:lysozyme inhibitor LprI family protein [Xanthobacteraceae bacterium]
MKRVLCAATAALILGVPGFAQAANYAPIDCAKAASAADRTICGNYALGQAEARMATLYGVAMSLVAMGQRGDIGDAQKQWVAAREACGANAACLIKAYDSRIDQLNKVIAGIASRGPY